MGERCDGRPSKAVIALYKPATIAEDEAAHWLQVLLRLSLAFESASETTHHHLPAVSLSIVPKGRRGDKRPCTPLHSSLRPSIIKGSERHGEAEKHPFLNSGQVMLLMICQRDEAGVCT